LYRVEGQADAQPLALALANTPGVVADILQLLQHGAGLLIEEATRLGQPQRAFAHHQQGTELVLQLADLPAQWWLGNVQQLGGAGEVEGFGQDRSNAGGAAPWTSRVWWEIHLILDGHQGLAQSLNTQVNAPFGIATGSPT
jgi:hypothetical protein